MCVHDFSALNSLLSSPNEPKKNGLLSKWKPDLDYFWLIYLINPKLKNSRKSFFFLTDSLLMFSSAEELIKKYLFRFLKHYLHLTINFSTEYTKLFPKSFNHFESNSDSLLFWRWSVFFTFRSTLNLKNTALKYFRKE